MACIGSAESSPEKWHFRNYFTLIIFQAHSNCQYLGAMVNPRTQKFLYLRST